MAVIGAGYVGIATAIAATKNAHDVAVLERDADRVRTLAEGKDPLGEPGFDTEIREGRFRSTTDRGILADADVVAVCVGTPLGSGGGVDLGQLTDAAEAIRMHAPAGAVVLVRSTVPVGTCESLQRGALARQLVVSNPEFLREGNALVDVTTPDRIVAGGPDAAEPIVRSYYGSTVRETGCPLYWTDTRTAELSKYASNAFLATKLSFVNEIANLAAALNADGATAIKIMAADPRIGTAFTRPGIGWGGSCFPKDTRALDALAAESNYPFVILSAVIQQNQQQLAKFVDAILAKTKAGDLIAVLGLAFKPNTGDTRESPALELARALVNGGRLVVAFDPAVPSLPRDPGIRVVTDAYSAARSASAVAIATDWPEFGELDLRRLRSEMRGALLFDGRGQIGPDDARAAGLEHFGAALGGVRHHQGDR